MNAGNFSEAAGVHTLYDPQPVAPGWQGQVNPTLCPSPNTSYTNGYLQYQCRPRFTAEYGETGSNVNTIPASRVSLAGGIMMSDLLAISKMIGTPTSGQLAQVHGERLPGTCHHRLQPQRFGHEDHVHSQ